MMTNNLQSDEFQHIHSRELNLVQGSPRFNQPAARLAIETDTVIKLHDIARSLQPKEALEVRAIADYVASILKRR
jgi:hypothetical protein